MHPAAKAARARQSEWAHESGIEVDSAGYTLALSDNLFIPLSKKTLVEFAAGDGGELGGGGKRGKMQALHSSSALVVNVFESWRQSGGDALATALGTPEPIADIRFEQKYSTGLRGKAPNLDAALVGSSGSIIAVESKFLEPYGSHASGVPFKPKYFESPNGLWRNEGYPGCQALAERMHVGEESFRWLNAGQALKHILGLSHSAGAPWSLIYLWYDVAGDVGAEHAAEATRFADVVLADGIAFQAMSYQALFGAIKSSAAGADENYLAYLGRRYFE